MRGELSVQDFDRAIVIGDDVERAMAFVEL
jgi:hypothetical protein